MDSLYLPAESTMAKKLKTALVLVTVVVVFFVGVIVRHWLWPGA